MKHYERVHFRLLRTPCCGALLCWVNPRLPTFCPECAARVFPDIRGGVLISDETATLRYNETLT